MWYIWPIYAILLVVMTFLSIVLARLVDALDKKTNLSGGLLGGILLAGITSLPELITSLSAILLIGNADMTFGNILGSNFFDVTIIGFIMLLMFFIVRKRKISKNSGWFVLLSLMVTVIILVFNIFGLKVLIPGINVNILSIIALVAYIVALVLTNKPDKNFKEEEVDGKPNKFTELSVKKIILWFVLSAICLVGVSVGITYVTDSIATTYSIGSSIAGALFLGVATSLPEVITSIELVRLGNFNIAVGDIFGSCVFNYLVLTIADIFYFSGTVFEFNIQTLYFASFMTGLTMLFGVVYLLKKKNAKIANHAWLYIVSGGLMVAGYLTGIILSM